MFLFLPILSLQFLVSVNDKFPIEVDTLADAMKRLGIADSDVESISIASGILPQKELVDEQSNYSITQKYANLQIFSTVSGSIENNALPAYSFYHSSIQRVSLPTLEKVGKSCFYNCTKLTNFTANNLQEIGINGFRFCTQLKSLTFPKLIKVGNFGFMGCTLLSSIEIPLVESVGSNAFQNAYLLFNIKLPKCTSIGTEAFRETGLLTITLSDDLAYLGSGAFWNSSNLHQDLTFKSLTEFKSKTFQNCALLLSVNAPKVTKIGDSCFYNCTSLSSVDIPSLKSIGYDSFYNTGINSISTPNVEKLEGYSFFKSSITLFDGKSVTDLGRHVFRECKLLKTVSLPQITSIPYSTFEACELLETVKVGKVNSVASYAFDHCANLQAQFDFSTLTTIGNFSFQYSSIKTIDAPLLTQLGESAFAYSTHLTSFNIPNLEVINASCFQGCTSLGMEIDLPNLKYLGDYAFDQAIITKFTATKLEYAGERAFNNCESLKSAYIPETCTFIGYSLFFECTHLEEVTLLARADISDRPNILMSSPLKYLKLSTFMTGLNLQKLEAGATVIVTQAAKQCPAVSGGKYTVQSKATIIDEDAFNGCEGISEITIPYTVQTINARAFQSMYSLAKVTFDQSSYSVLQSMKQAAFRYCTKLTEFTIPKSVTEIGDLIFSDDPSLTKIYVSSSFDLTKYEAILKEGNSATIEVKNANDEIEMKVFANSAVSVNSTPTKTKSYEIIYIVAAALFAFVVIGAIVAFFVTKKKDAPIIQDEQNYTA